MRVVMLVVFCHEIFCYDEKNSVFIVGKQVFGNQNTP